MSEAEMGTAGPTGAVKGWTVISWAVFCQAGASSLLQNEGETSITVCLCVHSSMFTICSLVNEYFIRTYTLVKFVQ